MSVRQAPGRVHARVSGLALAALMVLIGAALGRRHLQAAWWAHRVANARSELDLRDATDRLARVGPASTGTAIKLLNDQRPEIRLAAVAILAAHPNETARSGLFAAFTDPAVEVRVAAAVQFGIIFGHDSTETLVRQAAHGRRGAAMASVVALEKTPTPSSDEALRTLARAARDPCVRAQAIESLARRRDTAASALLLDLLADDAPVEAELMGEWRDRNALRAFASRQGLGPADAPAPTERRVADIAAAALIRLTGADCDLARTPRERIRSLAPCWAAAATQPAHSLQTIQPDPTPQGP